MGEGRLVNYSASGNTFQENPGYTKNYNFSDLQFNPKAITGDVLQGNTIDFEVYGNIILQLQLQTGKFVFN